MRLRLDEGFTKHPKVIALGTKSARWTWLEVLSYTCQYGSHEIPPHIGTAVPGANRAFIERCVQLSLVERTETGQLFVHDWHIYNGSIEERVRVYLEENPEATANEVQSHIQGRREIVLGIVKRLRQVVPTEPESGSQTGTTGTSFPVPEAVPSLLLLSLKEQEKSPNGLVGKSADVTRVYEHWRKARHKNDARYNTISDGRRAKIKARLHSFTAEQLCQAIDNVAKDDWGERAKHDDLTKILRNDEQVDYFLEMANLKNGKMTNPFAAAQTWIRNEGWQYGDHVIIEELGKRGLESSQRSQLVELAMELQQQVAP